MKFVEDGASEALDRSPNPSKGKCMLEKVMMLHNLSNNPNCRRISTIDYRPSYIHFSYLAAMVRNGLRCGRMLRLIRPISNSCTISMLSCCADWDAIKIQ